MNLNWMNVDQAVFSCCEAGLCLLLLSPIRKRRHFWLRTLPMAALYVAVTTLMAMLEVFWFFQLLVKYALLTAWVCFAAECTPKDGLYHALWTESAWFLSFCLFLLLQGYLPNWSAGGPTWFFMLNAVPFCAAVGLVLRLACIPKLSDEGRYHIDRKLLLTSLLTAAPFNLFNFLLVTGDSGDSWNSVMLCEIFAWICCMCALYMQRSRVSLDRMSHELTLIQQLWQQRQAQYEQSRANIDLINHKCHDLKHQVAALRAVRSDEQRERYLNEVDRSIRIYDSDMETGNEVLDTLLTEKSLYCQKWKITIRCIADGAALSFLDAVDLYTIFGNALDNAFESVVQLDDPEKRLVGLSVIRENGFCVVTVDNYVETPPAFQDGLPVTTKEQNGYHGFGLKSIRYTAEKYGGAMTVGAEKHLFTLRVLLPEPEAA